MRMPGPRRALDRAMLKAPLFGPLLRERLTAQLTRGLATLLSGGLDLPQALVVARNDYMSSRPFDPVCGTVPRLDGYRWR